ncbi:hypothetical protein Tco_0665120 [Tanacetum coccineum]
MVPRKILTKSAEKGKNKGRKKNLISLNTARQSHFNVVRTNRVNAVKASACWVWRPIKPNSASITLKRYDYVDGNPETELEDSVRLNSPEDKKSNLADYKRGLASVEEQLVFYRKNEVFFDDKIAFLKRDVSFKDSDISWLKSELEKVKLEKESYHLKIENFKNASKRFFSPPNIDLSNSGLEEFQEPEFEGYGPKTSKSASEDISNEVRKSNDAPLVEKLVSDDKSEKKIVFPTVAKIEFVKSKQQEKPFRKPIKSGLISRNTAKQSHFNALRMNLMQLRPQHVGFGDLSNLIVNPETKLEDSVRLNSPEDKKVYNGLGSQEGLIFLFARQPRNGIGRFSEVK